jgi:hypothetical protein
MLDIDVLLAESIAPNATLDSALEDLAQGRELELA